MSKVDLTLGESKTKVDLTLESKDLGLTWDTITGTWNDHTETWDAPKGITTKESKTKVNLTLESK